MDFTTAIILVVIGAVIGGTVVWSVLRNSVDRKAHALVHSYHSNMEEARRAESTVVPIRRVPADNE